MTAFFGGGGGRVTHGQDMLASSTIPCIDTRFMKNIKKEKKITLTKLEHIHA